MNHFIILAGGKGTRMGTDHPKVLTLVGGVPILHRLLDAISPFCKKPTIIIGHKGEQVRNATKDFYDYVHQEKQLGTGHAIICAQPFLSKNKNIRSIIVLPGDHPLISRDTVQMLIDSQQSPGAIVSLASLVLPSFDGENSSFLHYGRIVKSTDGSVCSITEYKDASEEIRSMTEVNLSYYCFDATWLWENIECLKNDNVSGEFYLTDMIGIAHKQGKKIVSCSINDKREALGINTPLQLKMVESYLMQ